MSTVETTLQDFRAYLDKINALECMTSLAYYDFETDMPEGAREAWGKKLAIAQSEAFAMQTGETMGNFLRALTGHEAALDEVNAAIVRNVRRDYEKYKRIPPAFMREMAEARSVAQIAWEKAKRGSDFAAFAPHLQKNIAYAKQYARLIRPDGDPYDTLLDEYEQGMTTEALDRFFTSLRERIVPLLKRIAASPKKIDKSFLAREVPIGTQKEISALMMRAVGYDESRGQIRETEHPFSVSFGKYDARITTHYHARAFTASLFSVLHECGHAMYEQNKADRIADTVLDRGASMATHESQSRFYENIVGRSRAFIGHHFVAMQGLLGPSFSDVTEEAFFEAVNAVEPSLIRVEADELTYSLHIMVRYEMERLFMAKDIDVMDLPALWNEKMREYLGVDVPDDARGILQDVHWCHASIGYFPSYALGSAYAAQLLRAMRRDVDVDAELAKGNVAALTAWLTERLQQYGAMVEPGELLARATGEAFNPAYYAEYLEGKFTRLYGL